MDGNRLENDTSQLTDAEKTAIRSGLTELRHLTSRLTGDVTRMSRGSAALDLNRMTGLIGRMRSALLEFPDKPDPDSQLSRFIDIIRS